MRYFKWPKKRVQTHFFPSYFRRKPIFDISITIPLKFAYLNSKEKKREGAKSGLMVRSDPLMPKKTSLPLRAEKTDFSLLTPPRYNWIRIADILDRPPTPKVEPIQIYFTPTLFKIQPPQKRRRKKNPQIINFQEGYGIKWRGRELDSVVRPFNPNDSTLKGSMTTTNLFLHPLLQIIARPTPDLHSCIYIYMCVFVYL